MIPNPTIEFKLGGQDVIFNELANVLIINIHEPFYSAGKILSWPSEYGSPGFGLNKEILRFAIIDRKLKVLIRCDNSPQKKYWASYDTLASFISNHNTEYFTHGMWLHLFPWKLFHPKPNFSNAL